PHRSQFDLRFLQQPDFFVEGGKVLPAPVVGVFLEPEFLKHLDTLRRRSLLGIERHNAPRDEVITCEDCRYSVWRRGGGRLGRSERNEGEKESEAPTQRPAGKSLTCHGADSG